MHWLTSVSSLVVHSSIDNLLAIHGHDGKSTIAWVDNEINDMQERDNLLTAFADATDIAERLNRQIVECNRLRILIHKVANNYRQVIINNIDEESYEAFCLAIADLLKEDENNL